MVETLHAWPTVCLFISRVRSRSREVALVGAAHRRNARPRSCCHDANRRRGPATRACLPAVPADGAAHARWRCHRPPYPPPRQPLLHHLPLPCASHRECAASGHHGTLARRLPALASPPTGGAGAPPVADVAPGPNGGGRPEGSYRPLEPRVTRGRRGHGVAQGEPADRPARAACRCHVPPAALPRRGAAPPPPRPPRRPAPPPTRRHPSPHTGPRHSTSKPSSYSASSHAARYRAARPSAGASAAARPNRSRASA